MQRFQRQFALFSAVVLLAAALVACKDKGSAEAVGGDAAVAATVNGKNIPLKEVDFTIRQQVGDQFSQLSPTQLAAARIQALEGLIQQEALFQRAEGQKLLPTDEEVTQAINNQKRQANFTEEEYQKTLQESGLNEQSIRDLARKQLAIKKLVDSTTGKITLKDNEVVEFYNANKDRFVTPRGVALSTIVADPSDSSGVFRDDAKNDFEAQNKINEISAALKRGEDFATLAGNRSEDQSALRGGDIGFATEEQLRRNGFPRELVANLMGPMKPGDVTEPMKMEDGRYYIFKLTDKRLTTENRTLDSPGVRDEIKSMLVGERQRIMEGALRLVAMNEAKVVNNLASDILKDPSMLGGLTPAQGSVRPAATAAPPADDPTAAKPQATGGSPGR